ncbi:MAG: HEAT repeat domain-containing protein [Candidatus Hydrogenedentes bacterium]|nr:HEAT repeat domain-containing protein [Candidatus Hydrogenedentota bacterium]
MVPFRGVQPIGLGLVFLLVAGCATDHARPSHKVPSTYSPELLAEVLGQEDFDFWFGPDESYVKRSAIELGDEAVPSIAEMLHNASNDETRRNAYIALAYIGGPKAVEVLRDYYSKTGDVDVLVELCFALGSTGTTEDRQYLLETMEQQTRNARSTNFGARRAASSALYTLDVLREQRAIPTLEEMVRLQGLGPNEVNRVLQSIEHGYWSVPMLANCMERDKVILAVLRSGLDNSPDAETVHLHELDSNRTWIRSPDGWDVAYDEENAKRKPWVQFDVFISSDGQRAICDTTQYYGPRAARGYDYVLRRDANEWKVVGLRMGWVS